jgi:hypothetical protein
MTGFGPLRSPTVPHHPCQELVPVGPDLQGGCARNAGSRPVQLTCPKLVNEQGFDEDRALSDYPRLELRPGDQRAE